MDITATNSKVCRREPFPPQRAVWTRTVGNTGVTNDISDIVFGFTVEWISDTCVHLLFSLRIAAVSEVN